MCISFGCDLNIGRVILSYMEKTKLPGSYFLLLGAGLLALMILVVSNDSQVGVKAENIVQMCESQTAQECTTKPGWLGNVCSVVDGKCTATGRSAGGDPSDETEDDTSAPGRSCCLGAGMMGVRDDSGACVPKVPCDTTSCGPAGCTANPDSGNGNGGTGGPNNSCALACSNQGDIDTWVTCYTQATGKNSYDLDNLDPRGAGCGKYPVCKPLDPQPACNDTP